MGLGGQVIKKNKKNTILINNLRHLRAVAPVPPSSTDAHLHVI